MGSDQQQEHNDSNNNIKIKHVFVLNFASKLKKIYTLCVLLQIKIRRRNIGISIYLSHVIDRPLPLSPLLPPLPKKGGGGGGEGGEKTKTT